MRVGAEQQHGCNVRLQRHLSALAELEARKTVPQSPPHLGGSALLQARRPLGAALYHRRHRCRQAAAGLHQPHLLHLAPVVRHALRPRQLVIRGLCHRALVLQLAVAERRRSGGGGWQRFALTGRRSVACRARAVVREAPPAPCTQRGAAASRWVARGMAKLAIPIATSRKHMNSLSTGLSDGRTMESAGRAPCWTVGHQPIGLGRGQCICRPTNLSAERPERGPAPPQIELRSPPCSPPSPLGSAAFLPPTISAGSRQTLLDGPSSTALGTTFQTLAWRSV